MIQDIYDEIESIKIAIADREKEIQHLEARLEELEQQLI